RRNALLALHKHELVSRLAAGLDGVMAITARKQDGVDIPRVTVAGRESVGVIAGAALHHVKTGPVDQAVVTGTAHQPVVAVAAVQVVVAVTAREVIITIAAE